MKRVAASLDLLGTLHAKGSLAPGDRQMNARLFAAALVFRTYHAGAAKDDLRAFDFRDAPSVAGGGPCQGRKSGIFGRADHERRLSTLMSNMLPEVRDAMFSIIMRDERVEDVGLRLSSYTSKATATAIGMTFLRIGLRQVLEGGAP